VVREAEQRGRHGFTRVDEDARPGDWVECLDRLHREPFYLNYKGRVRTILEPKPTGLYLEVGAGVGTDSMKLGAKVIGIDKSFTMCRESHTRGLESVVVADAEALPLPSELVDGCWSDRTFQHLADPERALCELIRVMKPGATVVLVDPDYGTQTMEFPDQDLAQTVFDFRADYLIRNGRLAHEMKQHFVNAGLEKVSVEETVLVVRDPTSIDNVMGLRSWARTACDRGLMSEAEVHRWEALYDEVVNCGSFCWAVSFFITTGCKRIPKMKLE
jgi:SAM-dependent methyltransferase